MRKTIERIVKHYVTTLMGLIVAIVSGHKILTQLDTVETSRLIIYGVVFCAGLALMLSTDTWIKKTTQGITDKITKK